MNILLTTLLLLAPTVETTPLTPGPGVKIFLGSDYRCDYWRLINYFETQYTNAYCSVASSVMVLNASGIEKPFVPRLGFPLFTQDNFFTPEVQAYAQPEEVLKRGMELDQLADVLETFGVCATATHGPELTVDAFREMLRKVLIRDGEFLIANYYRPAIGQKGGGHFSPIAAYNEKSDQLLILDVSRYKYPPFWVKTEDFYQSLLPIDPGSGKSRGIIYVRTDP